VQKPIERAITIMWERHDERLSLDELASEAHLSRFYFSRLFRSTTGTSPGRFLTAIRLYQAKIFLRETDWSVTDIAYGVGYNSLGTFIGRFGRSVGISPARYRTMSKGGMPLLSGAKTDDVEPTGSILGRLTMPDLEVPGRVYVGLFDSPIVQGEPSGCTIVNGNGDFTMPEVPAGKWFLRAAAISLTPDLSARSRLPLAVGACDNLTITPGGTTKAELHLHRTKPFDLPILFALPELDTSQPGGVRRRNARVHAQLAG